MIHSLQLVLLLTTLGTLSWAPGGMSLNVLVGSDVMNPVNVKQYLNVSTGFYLVMQPDCNLILYSGSQPLMSSNTSCAPGTILANTTLKMDSDGYLSINELVLGPGSNTISPFTTPIWSYYSTAGTPQPLYPYMILRDNGSCEFYDFSGNRLLSDYPLLTPYTVPLGLAPSLAPASFNSSRGSSLVIPNIAYPFPPELSWRPQTSLDGFPYLPAEYFLSQGSKLQTVDRRFVLTLGSDCNLQSKEILTNGSDRVVWESRTNSSELQNCQLMLHQDGRLQIRNNVSGAVYWNSTVTGNVSVSWILTLDIQNGGLSIRDIEDSDTVLWSNFYPNQTKPASQAGSKSNRDTTWIVVGVVGGAFVLATVGLALMYHYARASILKPERDFRRRIQNNVGKSQTLYSQSKIKEATNNFGKKIGYGGFGDVFYGKLADGQEVAAKVLSTNSLQSDQEFYNEIELLSVVHHKYLVSLLGYSCTRKHRILIYEYMGGGDLKQRLQGEDAAKDPLTWRQRTSITLQVAEGLEYLHDKCSPAIIHRDIKSNNILLTNKLVAKVADFGLSKLRKLDQEDATHITTVVKGTPGYLDPEYHEKGMLTEKSDVYAYGIVLMEILTGRPQLNLAQTVAEAHKSEQLDDLVDSNLGGEYDRDEFAKLVELSLWCAQKSNAERPFMRQVVQRLREIGLAPLQREGSSGYKSIQAMDLRNKEEVRVPLCGSPSGNMASEQSCDSRLCQFDNSALKRPITDGAVVNNV